MRLLAFIVVILLMPSIAHGASGPRWSTAELAEFADIVVTGRVSERHAGWDREVNAIYTYVTVDVSEVLKGNLDTDRVTVKQLGGSADGIVLTITDQPTFAIGEEVLLYLEARPRDGTLYTSALWQGKWNLERTARGHMAVRRAPGAVKAIDERLLLNDARMAAALSAPSHSERITTFDEPGVSRTSAGFNLLGPFRYLYSPSVDVHASGQPGLPGGGFNEVRAAIQRWNSAGSSFRYVVGAMDAPPRCSGTMLGSGRVTITFMDPCGEMSNTGGTLALGGSYYVAGEGGMSNGQNFDRAIEGFIINNDSPTALAYLTSPGCFEDIQTHELGHVLGLNHSGDPGALMYATIESSTCLSGARGLMPDDVAGLIFIYGRTSTTRAMPPTGAPTDVRVVANLPQLTVSWNAPALDTTAAPTGYRVDFRSGPDSTGPVVASTFQAATSLTVDVPAGTVGLFNVVVTGVNAAGPGVASPPIAFTLGEAGAICTTAPPSVTGLTGDVSNGFARVQWLPAAGATRYLIQAGTAQGEADLFPLTDLGASTATGANVASGFTGWARVFAANACGVSAPADILIQ